MLCLREASLGPVFGIKGGAAGGGYAQVVPMEDLNLHFTGDIHAIGAANNLLAAMLEAHILHGNELGIDPLSIGWRRCVDINDRALRDVAIGLGGRANGYVRQSGFDITAASEVMAIVAVARDLHDLRARLGAITVAYTFDGKPVLAEQLRAAGAMAVLLKDALKPNLVQTLEGQPALVHCGPFANIAHGNNSLVADLVALKLGDYVVTESGFGADMGMEKFLNIVCRAGGLSPSAVVLVATAKALKHHGGDPDGGLGRDRARRRRTCAGTSRSWPGSGCEAVVAVNRFPGDSDDEVELVRRLALEHGAHAAELNEAFERGGEGAAALAEAVVDAAEHPNAFEFTYPLDAPIEAKIEAIATARLRRRQRRLPPDREGQDPAVRRRRPRPAADLHGEDAPLALARPRARERADGVRAHRARRARLHGRRAGSSRCAARCRRCRVSGRARGLQRRHRRGRAHGWPLLAFLDLRLKEFLDAVPARTPAPGGGAVAAVAASLAAGLTAMAARFAPDGWERRAEIVGRAEELRSRRRAARGRRRGGVRGVHGRPLRRRRVERIVAVPLEIARLAAEVAELAAVVAEEGNPNVQRRRRGRRGSRGRRGVDRARASSRSTRRDAGDERRRRRRGELADARCRAGAAAGRGVRFPADVS